jgi:ABC-type lipoprotein release transport system permease subunit
MQYGTYNTMEANAIRQFVGEVQVQRSGYHEEQTLAYALQEQEQDWDYVLGSQAWLDAYTRRMTGYGLVSADSASAGALLVGIEPTREPRVSLFVRTPTRGELLAEGDDHAVVLGDVLARNLYVGIGDTVVVLTQGYRNQMGADVYVLKGTVRTGSTEMDRALVVMPLHNAQELFSMPGRFTQVVLRTDDFHQAGRYATELAAGLDGDGYAVLDWDALMPELRQMIVLDRASSLVFLGFLVILLWFEIVNTTTMSVMERVREFGILQSIGMKPGQLSLLVALELLIKIALALLIGLALAGLMVWLLEGVALPIPEELLEMYEQFGLSMDGMSFGAGPSVVLEPLAAVAIASLIAVLYPIYKVYRLRPVEALRSG